MRPYDTVKLNIDIPVHEVRVIPAGTEGAIVEEFGNGTAFLVECFDADGNTLDIVDVRVEQLTLLIADFYAGESVALLDDLPSQGLRRGQVGTIEKRIAPRTYEVVFIGNASESKICITLDAEQLLILFTHPDASRQTA